MKRIVPEVERLMWLIAEERDPRAISDFEARFPGLKLELAKRISMVSGLKSAGRKAPPHDIPRFVPRNHVVMPQPVNRSLYVAAAFVLGALAFGAYAAKSMLTPSHPDLPPVPIVKTNPPENPGATTYTVPSPGKATEAVPDNGTKETPNELPSDNPLLRPVTFRNVRAPLEAALVQICKQAGLTYQMAPGMPQVEVVLNYEAVAAGDVLEDLGRRYKFTPYPQERGSLLFLPVLSDEVLGRDTPATLPDAVSPTGSDGTKPKEGGVPIQKRPDGDH